ncbi:MAG: hypothetical protein RLZZ569_39 [Bacteroidota bacterium]|jgi:hypothetical protein
MKKFASVGALIGFIFIGLLLLSNKYSSPTWGKWWQLKPLLVVPLTCAIAGSLIYVIHPKKPFSKWRIFVFLTLALLGFLFSLWIGIIIGLDGTLWN